MHRNVKLLISWKRVPCIIGDLLRRVHGTVYLTHYRNCRLLLTLWNIWNSTCSLIQLRSMTFSVKCSWGGLCCLQRYKLYALGLLTYLLLLQGDCEEAEGWTEPNQSQVWRRALRCGGAAECLQGTDRLLYWAGGFTSPIQCRLWPTLYSRTGWY